VILLGYPTHLKAKAGGENSMWGKVGCSEAAKRHAGRGPDGMVKAELLEPQCPFCKPFRSDTADEIRCFPELPGRFSLGQKVRRNPRRAEHAPGSRVTTSDRKDTNEAPKPS
jgi:hypothetical protein